MARIYAELIKKGLKVIEEVPEKLRAEVQAILGISSMNYNKDGEQ